jgi:hypothetical protein
VGRNNAGDDANATKKESKAPGTAPQTSSGVVDYRINDGGLRATPLDIYIGVAARVYIAQFLAMTRVARGKAAMNATSVFVSGGLASDSAADRSMFSVIIEKLILFVQGYPVNATKAVLAGFVPDKRVVERRQRLFKEQGIISQLLEMLLKLKPLTKAQRNHSNISNQSMAAMSTNSFNMLVSPMYVMGKSVVVECLKLLLELIRSNPQNQMYIAGHMLIVLSHVIVDPLAGIVTKEMLSSNRELQETMIKFKEISIFAEQMRQQEMNSMCLQLLHACCSCQGVGIPRIQLIINQVIYEDFQDVLVQSRIDFNDDFRNNSSVENAIPLSELYLPPVVDPNRPLLGADVLSRGFPNVILTWVSTSNKYSPVVLFGTPDVSMMDVFRPKVVAKANVWANIPKSLASSGSLKTDSQREHKQNQIATEKKRKIADFYSMQLLLAAELCLGRNYRIIEQMESYYPYEMLVAIMKNCVNEDAKAAASRLILCLYVDRDPQLEILLPRLCRTWSEIADSAVNGGNTITAGSGGTGGVLVNRYKFGIVQMLLSDHLKDIVGQPFAANTTSYLELLHHLVRFSFYNNEDVLRDIIDPMVRLLYRDSIAGDIPKSAEVGDQPSKTPKKTKAKKNKLSDVSSAGPHDASSGQDASNVVVDEGEVDESFEGRNLNKDADSTIIKDSIRREAVVLPKMMDYFNSVKHMTLITALVVVAIGFAVFFTIYVKPGRQGSDDGSFGGTSSMKVYVRLFKLVVLLVFGAETAFKCFVHIAACKQTLFYFMNPFNIVDVGVVVLLLLAYFTQLLGSFALFACAPRLLRVVEIVRTFRKMRSIEAIVDANIIKRFQNYMEPLRYRRTGDVSMRAMVEIVSIIGTIQNTIQERNISIFLKGMLVLHVL